VKQFTEEWIEVYNNERPRDSLNYMTPAEFRNAARLFYEISVL